MTERARFWFCNAAALAAALFVSGCDGRNDPQSIDSQTNWLRSCRIDSQCGSAKCVCGVCTETCSDDSACADRQGASCVEPGDEGAIAQCGGTRPAAGLCMPRCDDAPCADKQMCVAGVCTPVPTAMAEIAVNTSATHQALVGFGASVAYVEDEITSHPQKSALYTAIFSGLGLDVLRLRDRYGHTGDDNLATAKELIDAATASLGRAPAVFMTSWSPPAALKANNSVECNGNAGTCTLLKTADGTYDYTTFAGYLRSSLDAYATAGVFPDYFGIQNNPNWLPTSAELGEACVFLPEEGTTTVLVNGVTRTVTYPGYAEAEAATLTAFAGLATPPRMLAPETSDYESVTDYVPKLDLSQVAAFSHHLYGVDPDMVDTAALAAVGAFAAGSSRPIFQTEMQADGLGTAMLIHYTTAVEGASAYLQTTLTSSATGPATNTQALVGLDDTSFTLEDPYYAFQQYALHTDPGWTRVDANSDTDTLLASAWLAPTGTALTVILINSGTASIDAKLTLPAGIATNSAVSRTVFGGAERGAQLGRLSTEGVLTIPARAVATVAFTP